MVGEKAMTNQTKLDQAAGAALRELRERAGRSQEDVSIDINLDQSTLSKVERLGPGVIGWTRFCKIAEALGCEVEIVFRPAKREETAAAIKPVSRGAR